MTTDNRTNEQLAERLRQFAESQAMDFDSPHVAMTLNEVADRLSGTVTEAQVEAACDAFKNHAWGKDPVGAMRAALVAAQGAAPQAAKDIHEPNHDRVYCVRCGGNWPCQPAPVLPSSGVDEDKLAEAWERGHAAFEQAWESDHLFPYDYATDNPYRKAVEK